MSAIVSSSAPPPPPPPGGRPPRKPYGIPKYYNVKSKNRKGRKPNNKTFPCPLNCGAASKGSRHHVYSHLHAAGGHNYTLYQIQDVLDGILFPNSNLAGGRYLAYNQYPTGHPQHVAVSQLMSTRSRAARAAAAVASTNQEETGSEDEDEDEDENENTEEEELEEGQEEDYEEDYEENEEAWGDQDSQVYGDSEEEELNEGIPHYEYPQQQEEEDPAEAAARRDAFYNSIPLEQLFAMNEFDRVPDLAGPNDPPLVLESPDLRVNQRWSPEPVLGNYELEEDEME